MQRRYEPFKEVFVYVEGESYKTELIEQMTIESPQASLKSEMFNMSTSELRRLAGKES
ncbi:1340_t:CDS:2 [Rhizophagus irregularis]|nr:1340_t:CDS:2 [Rhizophagus irregularis]